MTTNDDPIPVLDRIRDELVTAAARTSPEAGSKRRHRLIAYAIPAFAAVSTALLLVVSAIVGGEARRPLPSASVPPAPVQTFTSAASCVEPFSLENLGNREYGLDGTIAAIEQPAGDAGPAVLVVEVAHWYKGGSGEIAELRTYDAGGGITTGGDDGLRPTPGQRILASGDGGFLWACGFSMLHTAGNERIFQAAFDD